jgi:hypothetical protein
MDKEYSLRRLLRKLEIVVDQQLERGTGLFDRFETALGMMSGIPRAMRSLDEITVFVRKVDPMLPRFERMMTMFEQIDTLRLVARADNFVIRLQKLPYERLVESAFNTMIDVRNMVDIARQFQRQAPQLFLLLQQQRGRPEDDGSARATTATPTPDEEDSGNATTSLPANLVNIDPRLLARFDAKVIRNLNPDVIRVLTPAQIMRVNATYFNRLSPSVLRNIRADVVTEIDPKMLEQVDPEILNALPGEIIRDLTPARIRELDPELLKDVDVELVRGLEPETIRALLFGETTMMSAMRRNFVEMGDKLSPEMMKKLMDLNRKMIASRRSG